MKKIIHGDCLEVMKGMEDKSIDAIITDIPYGTTNCAWDIVIPFDLMWKQLNRIIKDNGAITNEQEIILDFTSGSGTTAIACENTNRGYYCIEKEKKYYDISVQRVKDHVVQTELF